MILIRNFVKNFSLLTDFIGNEAPWTITSKIRETILALIAKLGNEFIVNEDIAIHKTAIIEEKAVIKGPAIIGENCFIAANSYFRGGVILDKAVTIGPGCEIKSSIICSGSSIAHFNFIGDSIVGQNVNFEAGSIIANYYNERVNKRIFVMYDGKSMETGSEKFGALIGDDCRIGANAVLSPGTILPSGSIVKRLELIKQI